MKALYYVVVVAIIAVGLGSVFATANASSTEDDSKQAVSFGQAYTDIQVKNAEVLGQK